MTVRTSRFQNWFGDWEKSQHKAFLEGNAIKVIDVNRFKSDAIINAIHEYFLKNHNGEVSRNDLGRIELGRSGIRTSVAKGMSDSKAAAFEAVPDVISSGQIIDTQRNWKGRGYDTYAISAPVMIQGKSNIVSVIISQDINGKRFRLQRVDVTENLRQGASKTGASAGTVELTQTPAGDVRSILQSIFSVNENDVSKVVDENGEQLVVYHGTDADFEVFDIEKAGANRDAGLLGTGLYFSSDPDKSHQTL